VVFDFCTFGFQGKIYFFAAKHCILPSEKECSRREQTTSSCWGV